MTDYVDVNLCLRLSSDRSRGRAGMYRYPDQVFEPGMLGRVAQCYKYIERKNEICFCKMEHVFYNKC